jgi:diguanylate cyclase (GGDEF)-like protein/PAS domain S-box-containing protein
MDIPRASEDQFYKNLMDNLYDGVYFVDRERRITYWNNGAVRITGYQSGNVVGRLCNSNLLNHVTDSGQHLCEEGCPLLATIQDGKPREAEVYLHHAEGHRVPILVRTSAIQNEEGKILGAVEVFSNNQTVFKMRRQVDQLEQNILLDALTGIGNRAHSEIKIKSALEEYKQHGVPFGLLFLDVDRFKIFNDTYGHAMGDKVLQSVAKTLRYNLRTSDTCGRWGGEEFIVLLLNVNAESLNQVAEKLRFLISQSSLGDELTVTISFGATLVRSDDTFESIVQRADSLMYQSKLNGRNRVTCG